MGDDSDSEAKSGGVILNPSTTTKTEIASICQLIDIEVTLPYVSPLQYIQWEKGVRKVFAFVPNDLMAVKAIILKTTTSEQQQNRFPGVDHQRQLQSSRKQMINAADI